MRWRELTVFLFLAVTGFAGQSLQTNLGTNQSRVQAVESIGFTVGNLQRSVAFFTKVLDFTLVTEREQAGSEFEHRTGLAGARARSARLQLGDEQIELTEFIHRQGRPYATDSTSNDHWFQHVAIIVTDMKSAVQRLREYHVSGISESPQRLPDWNPKAGGIEAYYFADPDGHPLEVLHFPPDKGEAKWHRQGNKLFIGIDHTAIVVADTERSLKFYRDKLGMRIAGTSENYGLEQEKLNHVSGARLRITTLRAGSGPGIELLEYRQPMTGRPAPADTRANDLWYWHINVTATSEQSQPAKVVRDSDGHALLIQPIPR
jgi:catechol 2,3-dioxygenase-like lactoylglutathione lyase family enzyme